MRTIVATAICVLGVTMLASCASVDTTQRQPQAAHEKSTQSWGHRWPGPGR